LSPKERSHDTSSISLAVDDLALLAMLTVSALAADMRLTDNGAARCVIVVTPQTMTWEGDNREIDHWGRVAGCTPMEAETEKRRRLQRDSVADLALYLGKMSGAKIEIVDILPGQSMRLTP